MSEEMREALEALIEEAATALEDCRQSVIEAGGRLSRDPDDIASDLRDALCSHAVERLLAAAAPAEAQPPVAWLFKQPGVPRAWMHRDDLSGVGGHDLLAAYLDPANGWTVTPLVPQRAATPQPSEGA